VHKRIIVVFVNAGLYKHVQKLSSEIRACVRKCEKVW